MTRRRLAVVALPAAVALVAACFGDDLPTEQIGGTEYGMLLNVPTPTRVPLALVRTRAVTGQASTLDSIVVTLANFKPLAGGAAYQFYAVGAGAGDTVPVTAQLSRIRNDSAVNAAGGVTVTRTVTALGSSDSFTGTQNNDTLVARFGGAQFGGTSRQFLVITIQSNGAAPTFTAATPRPVWFRYRNATTPFAIVTTTGTAATFGSFSLTAPRQYSATGRGRSAFWDVNRDGRLVFSAIVEQISQPPLGYYYQPWIRDTRTRRALRIGELTDPNGASLRDADLLSIPGTSAQLPVGRFRTSEDEVGQPLNSFDGVHLVLEPKLGDTTHALTTVLQGTVGDTLGLRGNGAILVTVRRGAEAVAGATVVVVPVNGTAPVGSPRPATTGSTGEENGVALVNGIPAGEVELIVTPITGSAPAQRPRVTVIKRDTVPVVVTLP